MPFSIGPVELILVLAIALLVIGPGKLPEVGGAIGKSLKEFRHAASDVQDAASLEPPAIPVAVTAAGSEPPTGGITVPD
jgi:sec-independent protein translocase protein TatA